MNSLDGRNLQGATTRAALVLLPTKKVSAGFNGSDLSRNERRGINPALLPSEEKRGSTNLAEAPPATVTARGNKGARKAPTTGRRPTAMKYLKLNRTGDAVVVTFDMCSSSRILERLTLNADLPRFHNFLTRLKQYLAAQQQEVSFEPYKFTGDGWILLFPADTEGRLLLKFLHDLCAFFKDAFQNDIAAFLDSVPEIVGLTFGIEKGPLARMTIYGAREYVGRALNVACRLQGAVKDKGGSPAYRALVSNRVFNEYFANVNSFKTFKVTRALRNISGGDRFGCREMELLRTR